MPEFQRQGCPSKLFSKGEGSVGPGGVRHFDCPLDSPRCTWAPHPVPHFVFISVFVVDFVFVFEFVFSFVFVFRFEFVYLDCPLDLPSCTWAPHPISSTVMCVQRFLKIFLLALSLLWNPFCQALFCTYTALVKDFCKRQTSSLHWQARCHLCLQWTVFSLLLSSISLWKLPKS